MDFHQLNIISHVTAGSAALVVGLIALFSRKGGWLHRRSGWVTAGLGGVALATATVAVLLFDPPAPLVAATLSAGYQYLSGLRTTRLKLQGPGLPDAALALTALGLIALLALRMSDATRSWNPAIGYSTMGFLGMIATYDLSRRFWLKAWRKHVRPLDHGVKMIGFYFAMLSAGMGNLLAQWQPLSQLLPSMIGLAAMAGFAVYYGVRPPRAAPGAGWR